ncbi:MAG: hypothetical protein JNG84_07080, partial [Archangium sp.]|nr:hypothetical protein [Archangium sp.]
LLGAGAAGLVGGGLLAFQAFGREDVLLNEVALADQQRGLVLKPVSAYRQEAAAIQQQKIIGLTAAIAGAALIGLGVWLLPSAEQTGGATAALVPTPNGMAWVGVFP